MKRTQKISVAILLIIMLIIPIAGFAKCDTLHAATSKEARALELTGEIVEEYHLTGWGLSKKMLKNELDHGLDYFGYDDTFTKKEIKYAVDHCGINWKSEALYAITNIISVYKEYYDKTPTAADLCNDVAHLAFTKKEIKWALKKSGYSSAEIKEALNNR